MINASFLKKEIREFYQTPKLVILIFLFLFFAVLGPLTAKYMNEIIAMVASDIDISFPEPTYLDSWIQFFKNNSSLCLIVFLIIMTGSVSQEKNKGSIILALTKRVSRFNFIFSKFFAGTILFTVCFGIALVICGAYTQILFGEFYYEGLGMSLLVTWMMGVFYTSVGVFMSIIGKSPTISALFGFVAYAILNVFNVFDSFVQFNPGGAASLVNSVMTGNAGMSELWICTISTFAGTFLVFSLGYLIFRRQEI